MLIFANIATLFVVGSLFGWVLEVFFRRFFSQKKWMNPGFLQGPYLPIYGFGVLGMYALSEIFKSITAVWTIPNWPSIIIQILVIGVTLIVIEFIAGLIFIKGLGLKLWDYSDRWGNTMGIVCPLFDLLWTMAGAIYYFFIHGYLKMGIEWLAAESHNVYYLLIGVVLGGMIVDLCYSIHLASKLSKFAKENKIILSLKELQLKVKEERKKLEEKSGFIMTPTDLRRFIASKIDSLKDQEKKPSSPKVEKKID